MDTRAIFAEALKIGDPVQREAYLVKACADHPGLRLEVDAMLKASARAMGFLDTPQPTSAHDPQHTDAAVERPADARGADQPGEILAGKYRLIERIGEGGMGSVWYAEQREPVVRKVAVKLIKTGMASKGVLARFDAERQALAVMDHPNIARVLDGGVTPDGRPFFVMELVRGVPITTFCDQRRLTMRERLELFVPVCRALQHAHQKGIIHRDIKPSNVLVTLYDDMPVPKVIDFGIAKATGPKLTDMTLDTAFGAVVGTPTYMSPEQATLNQLDIDTRSDVYSLGVLLYELLVGSPPFSSVALKQAGLMEILRVIREDEPPRPSTKLSSDDASPSISANRRTEPRTLFGLLRNELDWVVMKALEKDRARRYESAEGFALDIQRYLAGEAVTAVPPSAGYRLRKFVRRHRGAVIAVSLLIAVLTIGIVGTTWGMFEADIARTGEADQRKKAEDRLDEANKARKRADDALLESRKLSATFALDNGLALCAKGDVAPGMLWLVRALEIVPPQAKDLERVIRINLADWRQELQPLKYVLRQPDAVFTMELSSDDQTIATGCGDKKVRVWDLRTGRLRYPPLEHKDSLVFVRFSPDGRWLATADYAGFVRMWDVATGKPMCDFLETAEIVDAMEFSPDGKILAMVDVNRALRLVKVPTGELTAKPIRIPGARVVALAYRPDGKFLVTTNQSQHAHVVETDTLKHTNTLEHKGSIMNVAFSSDSKYCVTIGKNPSGQLWDAKTFKSLPTTFTHQDTVHRAVFSPDGKRLATGSADQTVRLWLVETGQPIGLPMACDGDSKHIVFDRTGERILTGSNGGTAQLWDAATAMPIGARLHLDSTCTGVGLTGDASIMIASSWDGQVKVWRNALPPRAEYALAGLNGPSQTLEFSHDGNLLAAGDFGTCVHLWNVPTAKRIGTKQGEGRMVWHVAFTLDASKLVSACDTGKVQFWDTTNMQRLGEPIVHLGSVSKVIVHPKGDRIYTATLERELKKNRIRGWDIATRKAVGPEFYFRGQFFYDFAISPDGSTLLVGDDEGALLFDVESGKLRAKLAHDHAVLSTTFNRSGLALTCSADKTAGIWNTTGKLLQRIQHPSSVQFGQFSHDGESAATSGSGRDAIIWRVRTGETILRLQPPTSIDALAWGADDRTLLTGCADGHVRTWDVGTARLLGRPHVHKGSVRHIAVSPKHDIASAGVDGDVRLWRMPEPWTESPEVILRSIQRRCGMGMDLKTNAVFTLDAAQWQAD